jgi:hypothetical protein
LPPDQAASSPQNAELKERAVSDSPNAALIRRLYESRMAPEVAEEIMAPDLVWDITPGFPSGGVYHGRDNVVRDFFGTLLGPIFESMRTVAEYYYADDDGHVFVQGHYHAHPSPERSRRCLM